MMTAEKESEERESSVRRKTTQVKSNRVQKETEQFKGEGNGEINFFPQLTQGKEIPCECVKQSKQRNNHSLNLKKPCKNYHKEDESNTDILHIV